MKYSDLLSLFWFTLVCIIIVLPAYMYQSNSSRLVELETINQEMAKNLRESLEIQKRFLELFEDK